MPDDLQASIEAAIGAILLHASSCERILAALAASRSLTDSLTRIREGDPELDPELGVCLINLDELTLALDRAHTFSRARFDATLEKLLSDPPTKGDPA